MGKALEQCTPDELRKLRPAVGAVMQERIDALLGEARVADTPQKSTDPRDRMNGTEKRMALILDMRKRAGEIVEWWYESVTFRVGIERSHYRPDFVCNLPDGSLEIVEVKGGFVRDDARGKFQAAARQYPFARWRMLAWVKGEWRTIADYARTEVA